MCLIAFAIGQRADLPFVLAANRDEFHQRPARAAHFWPSAPGVLAGQDVQGLGTWLGVHQHGRFAALTNVRAAQPPSSDAPSRGTLVTDFLNAGQSAQAWLDANAHQFNRFSGFNMVLGDTHSVWFANNQGERARRLPNGVYGLSNATLDTPWDKVNRSKGALTELLGQPQRPATGDYLTLLRDLPLRNPGQTRGKAQHSERGRDGALKRIFVNWPDYGTRCSTVIQQDPKGRVLFTEQTFNKEGESTGVTSTLFRILACERALQSSYLE